MKRLLEGTFTFRTLVMALLLLFLLLITGPGMLPQSREALAVSEPDPAAAYFQAASLTEDAYCWVNYSLIPELPSGPARLSIPGGTLVSITSNHTAMAGSDFAGDTWYAVGFEYGEFIDKLYSIDPVTGALSTIGNTGVSAIFTGLAYDPVGAVLYASAFEVGYGTF